MGLDFGCGPGPTLHQLVIDSGYRMELYDPYFHPRDLTKGTYDFITCTEVVEHLGTPWREWSQLKDLLNPGGILGVMTHLYDDVFDHEEPESFRQWPYRRDDTHISFYSSKTMDYIANRFDFHLIECHHRWQIFQRC